MIGPSTPDPPHERELQVISSIAVTAANVSVPAFVASPVWLVSSAS